MSYEDVLQVWTHTLLLDKSSLSSLIQCWLVYLLFERGLFSIQTRSWAAMSALWVHYRFFEDITVIGVKTTTKEVFLFMFFCYKFRSLELWFNFRNTFYNIICGLYSCGKHSIISHIVKCLRKWFRILILIVFWVNFPINVLFCNSCEYILL